MYAVTRVGKDDGETHTRESLSTAVRLYQRLLRRHPQDHHRLTETGHLPGLRETTIAEEFGGPMKGGTP